MKLLIIEDDKQLHESLKQAIQKEGYEVEGAENGEDGLVMAQFGQYDAIILDIMLPRMNGFDVLHHLRKEGLDVPVLMLTAKEDVESRVRGLDAGADDYVIKPFAMPELFARLRALLRRKGHSNEEVLLKCGDIVVIPDEAKVTVSGEEVTLSKKEFKLLEFLLWNKGRILTKEQIFDRIWGFESDTTEGIVDLYIHYLRKKLGAKGAGKEIETVRGVGYRVKEC